MSEIPTTAVAEHLFPVKVSKRSSEGECVVDERRILVTAGEHNFRNSNEVPHADFRFRHVHRQQHQHQQQNDVMNQSGTPMRDSNCKDAVDGESTNHHHSHGNRGVNWQWWTLFILIVAQITMIGVAIIIVSATDWSRVIGLDKLINGQNVTNMLLQSLLPQVRNATIQMSELLNIAHHLGYR